MLLALGLGTVGVLVSRLVGIVVGKLGGMLMGKVGGIVVGIAKAKLVGCKEFLRNGVYWGEGGWMSR